MKLRTTITLVILSMACLSTDAFAKVDLAGTQFEPTFGTNQNGNERPLNLEVNVIESNQFTAVVEHDDSEPDRSIPVIEDIVVEEIIEQPADLDFVNFSRTEIRLILATQEIQELESITLSMSEETDEIELVTPDAPIDAPLFVARTD
jgi:hypothetical protein